MPKISNLYAQQVIAQAFGFDAAQVAQLLRSISKQTWATIAISMMAARLQEKGESSITPQKLSETIADIQKHFLHYGGAFAQLAHLIDSQSIKKPNGKTSKTDADSSL